MKLKEELEEEEEGRERGSEGGGCRRSVKGFTLLYLIWVLSSLGRRRSVVYSIYLLTHFSVPFLPYCLPHIYTYIPI